MQQRKKRRQYQNQILSQFLFKTTIKKIGAEIMVFIDLSTILALWFASWCTSDEAVFDT